MAETGRLLKTGVSFPRDVSPLLVEIEVGLLTGFQDRPYAYGLAMALVSKGVCLDIIGSDEVDSPEFHWTPNLKFLNLARKRESNPRPATRLLKLFICYARLLCYAAAAKTKIFHILWNNRIEYFDRTLLMLYFKALGKKVVITAHNVNQGRRDSNDSLLNRLTLKIQYRLCDHIFVHTRKMKSEICEDFGIRAENVTVLRHPINNAFPDTDVTPAEAKRRLGLGLCDKPILFFGRIRPYKGLEYLLDAFQLVSARDSSYRLIIAGESKKGSGTYFDEIQQTISR
ncbi:MAG: glycosyltransferase, partial [Terriglobia bacterium]